MSVASHTPGLLNEAAYLYSNYAPQYYPGATVAGLNDYQTQGIDAAIAGANQSAGYADDLMGNAQSGWGSVLDFAQGGGAQVGSQYTDMMNAQDFNNIQGNFEVNPFINDQADAFGQAAQRTLEQNILPSTVSNALGAGQMGSSRHGIAQGVATSNLGQSLQEQLSDLHTTAWQNAAENQLTSRNQTLAALANDRQRGTTAAIANANNQQNAYSLIPNAMNALNNSATVASNLNQLPGAAMTAGGQMYQDNAQAQINAERDRWDFYQNQPWEQLNNYAGILSGAPNTSNPQVASSTDPLNAAISGAGTGTTGASMLGNLFNSSASGNWGSGSSLGSGYNVGSNFISQ